MALTINYITSSLSVGLNESETQHQVIAFLPSPRIGRGDALSLSKWVGGEGEIEISDG